MTRAMPSLSRSIRRLLALDDGTLDGHAAVFERLVDDSPSVDRQPLDAELSVFWAQVAAEYAWRNHPGSFASDVLERRVAALAPPVSPEQRAPGGVPEHVLHVLTTAYPIGGHTRLAWRWIEADAERTSSVVLTRQGRHPVPAELRAAASGAGGTVRELGAQRCALAQAEALRERMADADVVVLHVHPYDALPIIALAGWAGRPPTILVNHADHVFWLGVSVADVVVCVRGSGSRLAQERRGVASEAIALLPIPIAMPGAPAGRDATRAGLGATDRTVIALSVASAYKFAARDGLDFVATAGRLLDRLPELMVLAAGPAPTGSWAAAATATGGRLRALGVRREIEPLYAAADVYLDSFPFASLTSLLEAASHGLPLVALKSFAADTDVLRGDGPGLDETVLATDAVEEYEAIVEALVRDPAYRTEVGRRTREAIGSWSGEGWPDRLASTYRHARTRRAAGAATLQPVPPARTILDERLAELGRSPGLAAAIGALLPSLPARQRWRVGGALWLAGGPPPLGAFVPDRLRKPLRAIEPLWRAAIALSRKVS